MTDVCKHPCLLQTSNNRAEELLDLSRSSWLMAAARKANLFLGKPTCFMNERPSSVSCFVFDLFEEGLHQNKPCVVFLRMDALSWSVWPVWIFKTHSCFINESLMRFTVVNHSFHTFHFSFLNRNLLASIYPEIAELAECTTTFSAPVVSEFSVVLPWNHQEEEHGRQPSEQQRGDNLPFCRSMSVVALEWKKSRGKTKSISNSDRWAQNSLFQPRGGGADRCSGPWKGCCAAYWKRGEAWCQGDLWKCRRRPADSAAIVPCFEASLRGYTEALCCSGLPSLSRFLLQAPGCSQCSAQGFPLLHLGSEASGSEAQPAVFPPSAAVAAFVISSSSVALCSLVTLFCLLLELHHRYLY